MVSSCGQSPHRTSATVSRWRRSTDDENLQSVVKWGTQDIPMALRNPP